MDSIKEFGDFVRWIGITGGIASGKSSFVQALRKLGKKVIIADDVAHQVLERGAPGFDLVIEAFGPECIGLDGEIDRAILGEKVFGSLELRQKLEGLLHPLIRERVQQIRQGLTDEGSVRAFYEIPLLFEKNLEAEFDLTVLISAPREVQLQRVQLRDGLNREQAEKRLEAQLPLEKKVQRADKVIENTAGMGNWEKLARDLLEDLS